jgi:hypothetical protein
VRRGIDGQEGEIAGVTEIQRARVQRFKDRRCRGKFGPFDLVGKVLGQPRDFEQRAIAALLIADAQCHDIRRQRRCRERSADQDSEQRSAGTAKPSVRSGFVSNVIHASRLFRFSDVRR